MTSPQGREQHPRMAPIQGCTSCGAPPLECRLGPRDSFSELMKCHSQNWVLKGQPSVLWDSASQALDKASCHVGGTHVARNQGQPPAISSRGILPAATEGAWKLILPQLGLKITRAQATPRLQLGRDPVPGTQLSDAQSEGISLRH